MLNILFIGDIVGRIGRKTVTKILPKIKKEYKPDLVIANAENAAHGSGVTEDILEELEKSGVHYFTTGDHCFRRPKKLYLFENEKLLRPANYSKDAPGQGFKIIKVKNHNILLINLIGRVFMSMDHDCPFHKLDEILANTYLRELKLSAIIIDIHAETTSEKAAFFHYANKRVSAVLGTHTHIMTADSRVSEEGTAFISDVGYTGAFNSCLGLEKDGILKTFLTQVKYPHVIPEKGPAVLNSVLLKINTKNAQAKSIKPITEYTNFK